MRMTLVGCSVALVTLVASSAFAQSLAALAAEEAARRSALSEVSPVYTNRDLSVRPAPIPPSLPPMPFVPELERTPPPYAEILATAEQPAPAFDWATPTLVAPWWTLNTRSRYDGNQWNRRQRESSHNSAFARRATNRNGREQSGEWPWVSQDRRQRPGTASGMGVDPFSASAGSSRREPRPGAAASATPFPRR